MGRPGSVDTAGQILSNYQAALHLLEEAVAGDVPPAVARDVLQRTAAEVFTPLRDAGLSSAVDELLAEIVDAPARGDVAAERQRIAATHSRLIRRRPALDDAAAARLAALANGSHSAGSLFLLLLGRWQESASPRDRRRRHRLDVDVGA